VKNGHCVFELPPGGLGATYAVQLRLIRKLVVDFLLVIIELFSLGVRAEALRANIDRKSPFLRREGSVWLKISHRRGRPAPTILRVTKVETSAFHTV